MRRFKEPLKTVLILLLTLSAVFLAWKGNLFSGLFPQAPPEGTASPEERVSITAAALPCAAMLTRSSGLQYGVKYDDEEMAELFDRFSALLAEALGSTEKPGAISEATWKVRLGGAGLYLEYDFPLPLSVLAAWVGMEIPWAEEETGTAFLLDHGGDGSVRLCFRSGEGRYYASRTAASWATLHSLLEEALPNGAAFAFSIPELRDCAPYSLILEELPTTHIVFASGGQSEAAAALAESFGIHLSGQSRYTEADGTLVYPGDEGALRLGADGSVSYTAVVPAASASLQPDTAEMIERGRRLLETIHDSYAGEETLSLSALRLEEGAAYMTFRYQVGGIPVELSDGPAAEVVWGAEGLREFSVVPRCYRQGDAVRGLLPEKQAAAAAGSLHPGAAACLILFDRGESYLGISWAVAEEGRYLWTQED